MLQPAAHSPFRDGFTALGHEPALLAAELTWRWCFGLAAWGLVITSALLFLDSLKVSPGDELLLGTLQPRFLHGAVQHVFRGSLNRLLWEQIVVTSGLMGLWAFAATVGRAATLRRLVAMFSTQEEPLTMRWEFGTIFVLNLLRAMWTLLAVVAVLLSLVAGIFMANGQHAVRAAFFLAFGVGLAWIFGVVLNWFFGLTPLFSIRNGAGAAEALSQTLDFCSRQTARLLGLGVGFMTLRLVWAGTLFLALLAPLRLVHHVAGGWIALIMTSTVVVYFAGTDLLYLARLGAYVALAEDDSHPVEAPPQISPSEPLPPDAALVAELA